MAAGSLYAFLVDEHEEIVVIQEQLDHSAVATASRHAGILDKSAGVNVMCNVVGLGTEEWHVVLELERSGIQVV